MPLISKVHHVAIICSDYARSLRFYTQVLGLEVLAEHYRVARRSYKTDLALNGAYVIELFSFPSPPPRPSYPEAAGLRHLAFEVTDRRLDAFSVPHEPVRIDEFTGRAFVFFEDPDHLPIEFYAAEQA